MFEYHKRTKVLRKVNAKFQVEAIRKLGQFTKWLADLTNNGELCRLSFVFQDKEMLQEVRRYCMEGAYFPFSLTPSGFRANRYYVKRLMKTMNQ